MAKTKSEPVNVIVRITNTKKKGIDLIPVAPEVDKDGNVLRPGFDLRTLIPGGNNVPLAHVKGLASHAGTRWYFDNKWLVIEASGEGEPEGPVAPESLAEYEKTEAAIAIVNAHDVMKDLQRWYANETRSDVQEAIGKRIETVKAAG